MSAVLPWKESLRVVIVEMARELEPYFPDITAQWRECLTSEASIEPQAIATLERVTFAAGCSYFYHQDFVGFFEHLAYFGTRLSKLQVDTRLVRRALEIYEELCEPYLKRFFSESFSEALAALEMISSAMFVAISGAYFDTRTRESNALVSVLDAELTEPNLVPMLQRTLETTCSVFDANLGVILLRDPESDLLKVEATVGLEESVRGEFSVAMGQGFSAEIVRRGEPAIVMDTSRDPRIIDPALRSLAKSLWGVPFKYEDKAIGVLLIGFSKPYECMPTESELLRAIADRSALAIHRARITDALREREARIAELSAHLLRVQEEERSRISRELHDDTGQGLMTVRLYLGMLDGTLKSKPAREKVKETVAVVDRTIEGIRRIIGHLSPLVLKELGLVAALRKEARDLELNRGITTHVAISDEVGRLGKDTETAIYRIVQESLHNIVKHAHAKNANITMTRENGAIRLVVEDDGTGIFPKSNFRGKSFGLAGIKERVSMLAGEVHVVSMKGQGTRIELTVPATEPENRTTKPESSRPEAAFAAAGIRRGKQHAKDKVFTH